MDTLVILKGVLNDCVRDDEQPNMVYQKFIVRHDSPENLKLSIDQVLQEVFKIGGLTVVKDESKPATYDNLKLVYCTRLDRLEFETKEITGSYTETGKFKQ